MRFSAMHIPTLKEAPKEAEMVSHQYMLRAGYIRKVAAGIYSFLPLGVRTLERVSRIIREEMNRAGAQEVLLPAVQPAELWQESGRWKHYGPELLRLKDRKGADFVFGPTHEEVIVDLARRDLRSYRDLPKNLYQIQVKFRDEPRPRAGLMRGREFIMKDAYSFDRDETGAKESYRKMYEAYVRICKRCGFDFRPVEADTGNIGGSLSHEFQVLADTGEDSMLACTSCGYAANLEKAEVKREPQAAPPPGQEMRKVGTPEKRTVEEVCAFLGIAPAQLVKTLVYVADGNPVAAMVRGDHELNEVKLKAALGCSELAMADEETVRRVTHAPVGFAGPVGLGIRLLADHAISAMSDFVVGGNEQDVHITGVNVPRDFKPASYYDLRVALASDPCPRCGAAVRFYRGIEIGHVFFLGTKYSAPMKATFLDEDGKEKPYVMGCYGIGVTRIMSAAIEQGHDEWGIKWPVTLAPFEAAVLAINADDKAVVSAADEIYAGLERAGVQVLYDDRKERPGVKFKDADLLGIPYQAVVGRKGLDRGVVELRTRRTGVKSEVPVKGAAEAVAAAVAEEYGRIRRSLEE